MASLTREQIPMFIILGGGGGSQNCGKYNMLIIKTGTPKTRQDKPLQRRWVRFCYHIIFFRLLQLISLCMAITTDKVLIFCFKVHTRHTRNKLKQGKCQSLCSNSFTPNKCDQSSCWGAQPASQWYLHQHLGLKWRESDKRKMFES